MDPKPLVNRILDDEGLTADLDGPAAEVLVAWLVQQAEMIAADAKSDADARKEIEAVCGRGRAIAQAVARHPAAEQLAALSAQFNTESP